MRRLHADSRRCCTRRACTTSSSRISPAAASRCPRTCLARDCHAAAQARPATSAGVRGDLREPETLWDAYEMCEKLVDVEEYFQLWRFRHMKTVERIIGLQPGHRRFVGCGLPQEGAGPRVLPGTAGRANPYRPGIETMTTSRSPAPGWAAALGSGRVDRSLGARPHRAPLFPRAGRAARPHLSREPFARPPARCDGRRRARRTRAVVRAAGRRVGRLGSRDDRASARASPA